MEIDVYEYAPNSDRLKTVHKAAGAEPYEYNSAGSPQKITYTSYQYNSHQRPIKVFQHGKLVAEYAYNTYGERTQKTVHTAQGSHTTHYLYEDQRLVAEANSNGKITHQYLYHNQRPVGAWINGEFYAVHTNSQGTPLSLTNAKQATVWQASYSAFGKAAVNDDADGDGKRITFNLRLPGQIEDPETGTRYNYLRDYNPETGRYLTSDPLGQAGGINTYLYANANPLKYTDPLGLAPIDSIRPHETNEAIDYTVVEIGNTCNVDNINAIYDILHSIGNGSSILYDETIDSIINPGRVRQRGPNRVPKGKLVTYGYDESDGELEEQRQNVTQSDLAQIQPYIKQAVKDSTQSNMLLTLSEPGDTAKLTKELRQHLGGLVTEADVTNLISQLPESYQIFYNKKDQSSGANSQSAAIHPPLIIDIQPLFEEIVARFQVHLHTDPDVIQADTLVHEARLELKSYLEEGNSTRCRRGREDGCKVKAEIRRLENAFEAATDHYQETLENTYTFLAEQLNWLPLISKFYDAEAERDEMFRIAASIGKEVVGIFIPLTVEDLAIEAAVLAATAGAGKLALITGKTGKAVRKIFRVADHLNDRVNKRIGAVAQVAKKRILAARYRQFAPYDNIIKHGDILRQMGGGACSFAGNTQVKTLGGFKAIASIDAANDHVWSKNEVTGHSSYKPVTARYSNTYRDTVHITIRNTVTGQAQTLTSNRIHPFFAQLPPDHTPMAVGAEGNVYQGAIARGAWVDAEHLQAGFLLLNDDESWSTVERVEVLPVELKAFNLSVADNHTYFVAANDEAAAVWVHNTCKIWKEDTLKILDDLLADPKIADRIAKNPKLLDGWKRVTEDFADSGGGNFNQYWEAAVARGNVKFDDLHDFASARNWKHPENPDWDLYPPNNGFDYDDVLKKFDRGPVTLSGGKKLDRYINNGVDPFDDTGEYLADQGVSLTSRALPKGSTDTKQLIQYRVAEGRQIAFESGKITPWFDEVGGSTQYYTKVPVNQLIADGDLIVIIPRPTPKQIQTGKLFINDITELPAGYKFVTNADGGKSLARVNIKNPDTPPLKVDADGRITLGATNQRTIDELAPGGKVPSVVGNAFNRWFDDLSPAELDDLWASTPIKEKIAARIRHPGGLHEWCMVCKMPEIKRWGISVDEVKRFRTKTTELTWTHPDTGLPGKHGGDGSGEFHSELGKIIDNSQTVEQFNNNILALIDRWSVPLDVVPDLILDLN